MRSICRELAWGVALGLLGTVILGSCLVGCGGDDESLLGEACVTKEIDLIVFREGVRHIKVDGDFFWTFEFPLFPQFRPSDFDHTKDLAGPFNLEVADSISVDIRRVSFNRAVGEVQLKPPACNLVTEYPVFLNNQLIAVFRFGIGRGLPIPPAGSLLEIIIDPTDGETMIELVSD